MAQIAGIGLDVKDVVCGAMTTSPYMPQGVYRHHYPAIIIKDNNGNSTTLLHPSRK